jgi:hypothetical protein
MHEACGPQSEPVHQRVPQIRAASVDGTKDPGERLPDRPLAQSLGAGSQNMRRWGRTRRDQQPHVRERLAGPSGTNGVRNDAEPKADLFCVLVRDTVQDPSCTS